MAEPGTGSASGGPMPVPTLPGGGTPDQQARYGQMVRDHGLTHPNTGQVLRDIFEEFHATGGIDPATGSQVPFMPMGERLGRSGFPGNGNPDNSPEQGAYNNNYKMASQSWLIEQGIEPGDAAATDASGRFDPAVFDPSTFDASIGEEVAGPEREAQRRALERLEALSDPNSEAQGVRADTQLRQREFDQQARGQREALEQNSRERGMGGGGLQMLGALTAGQNAAQNTSAVGTQLQADARKRALNALTASGNQANTMREAEEERGKYNAQQPGAAAQQAYGNRFAHSDRRYNRVAGPTQARLGIPGMTSSGPLQAINTTLDTADKAYRIGKR